MMDRIVGSFSGELSQLFPQCGGQALEVPTERPFLELMNEAFSFCFCFSNQESKKFISFKFSARAVAQR